MSEPENQIAPTDQANQQVQPDNSSSERQQKQDEALLALEEGIKKNIKDELCDKEKPVLLKGEPGVGKTWFARHISKEILSYRRSDSDEEKPSFAGTLWLSLEKRYHDVDENAFTKSLLEDLARQLGVLPPLEGGFESDGEKEEKEEEEEEEEEKADEDDKPNKQSDIQERKREKEVEKEEEKAAADDKRNKQSVTEERKRLLKELKYLNNLEDLVLKKLEEMTAGKDKNNQNRCVLLVLDGASNAPDAKENIVKRIVSLSKLNKVETRLKVLVTVADGDGNDKKNEGEFEVFEKEQDHFEALLRRIAGKEDLSPVEEVFRTEFFKANGGGRGGGALPAAVAVLTVKAFEHSYDDIGVGVADLKTCFTGEETPKVAVARFAFGAISKRKKKTAANAAATAVTETAVSVPPAEATSATAAKLAKAATAVTEATVTTAMVTEVATAGTVETETEAAVAAGTPTEEEVTAAVATAEATAAAVECCWHSLKFFAMANNFSVHYNELIANWILEGYFDHELLTHSIEKAYGEGYWVLTELLHRGILKVDEHDDYVSMDSLALAVKENRLSGFDRKARLGLPDVFLKEDKDWNGFGRIAVSDGMVRSIRHPKKRSEVLTMFVDGERLVREVPENFFPASLTTLVVTNPRLRSLEFLVHLKELKMLVLRGCDVLEDADAVEKLNKLIVLEISGGRLLTKLGDEVFAEKPQLRSLNLAESQLKDLPSSFLKLKKVRWLVLRGCSALETMPNLQHLNDLEVADVSGVSSLREIKGKNFGDLTKLRSLDFSQSHIAPLPFVHGLKSLTRLTLKGCDELTRLPQLKELGRLQVLQVAGAKKLREFYSFCLENKEALRILDLSGSNISVLPKTFKSLPKLEILNLSLMPSLKEFNVNLDEFTSLRTLNLSNTAVKVLPSLSKLKSLRELLLIDCGALETLPAIEELKVLEVIDLSRASELKELPEQVPKDSALRELRLGGCKKLAKLPILKGLAKLEVFDLSGCETLEETEFAKQTFNEMTSLQNLDLSRTKIKNLASLSSTLRRLSLENCTNLVEIPEPRSLSNLEKLNLNGAGSLRSDNQMTFQGMSRLAALNLSKTKMKISLRDVVQCTSLVELSLSGCTISDSLVQLGNLTRLEALDLSNISFDSDLLSGIESLSNLKRLNLPECKLETFPYWISSLSHLESITLPNLTELKEFDWAKIKRLPDNLNWEECGILEIPSPPPSSKPSFSVNGTKIFEALRKNEKKWNENFGEFNIYVCPSMETGDDDEVYRRREDKFFEDIYFQTINRPESCKRFLEIRGFENRPEGLDEAILKEVDCLSFIDNGFLKTLSDLGIKKLEAMTGLWIERCTAAVSISGPEHLDFGQGFSYLWASNLPNLKSLYNGSQGDGSFRNLTQLYLDCCPLIEYVFYSSQLPKNLEILEAKFCQNLKTLVKCETSSSSSSSAEQELPNLQELYLLELPELSSVGVKLPSLREGEVRCCPKLAKESIRRPGLEIRDLEDVWEGSSFPSKTK